MAIATAVLFGPSAYQRWRSGGPIVPHTPSKTEQARVNRTHAAVTVAPAPLPTALPLVERPGRDSFGYPNSYVDGAALRSLLHYGHYTELTSYFEELERQFEADHKKEYFMLQATRAFSSAEPELLPKLEAWVKASPISFAPHLALGAHWTAVASARRGAAWAKDTAAEDMAAMHEAIPRGKHHLRQALLNRPGLVAVVENRIWLAMLDGDDAASEQALKDARATCPECFLPFVFYLGHLEPRWGGSLNAMTVFAKSAPVAKNPKLSLLPGYVNDERSEIALDAKQYDDALSAANAACALGPNADFLMTRSRAYSSKGDAEQAERDIDAAIELRPDRDDLRMQRAELRVKKKAWEGAADDLLAVMRVSPTASGARWAAYHSVQGLDAAGWAAHQRHDRAEALRLLELASKLSPFDRQVMQHREQAVRAGVTGTPEEIAQLTTAANAAPDDFSAHQTLDFALARHRRFLEVIAMWNEYLERHPDDANALFERSGALFNSGHRAEAKADLVRACDLGIDQACAYLKGKL